MNGPPPLFLCPSPSPPSSSSHSWLPLSPPSSPRSFSCSYVIPTATLYPGASLSLLSERFHRRRFLGTCRRRRVCPCIASSLPRRSPRTYRRAFYFFSGADPFAFARTLRFAAIYYAPRSFLCIGARAPSFLFPREPVFHQWFESFPPFPFVRFSNFIFKSVPLSLSRTFLISRLYTKKKTFLFWKYKIYFSWMEKKQCWIESNIFKSKIIIFLK